MEEGHTHVRDVTETGNIVKTADGAEADGRRLDPESYVSMNFWGFPGEPPEFLQSLEAGFRDFFRTAVPANPRKAEHLLPTFIGRLLKEKVCTVKVLPTGDTWYGMTYREDVDAVKAAFAKMAGEGTYPEELYSDL